MSDFSRNRSYPASDYSPAFNKQTLFISPTKKITIQLKAKSLIALMDSVYGWQWDTVPNGWAINPSWKDINIVYDANNNLTSGLEQNWNGSAWVNSWQGTLTYDANNNLTSELYQNWNGTTWVNSWQHTYTYDANNNQTSYLYQTWNGSAWVNSWQHTYTYDANNNLTSGLGQNWNGTAWVNSGQSTYTYDANNNLTSGLGQNWNGTGTTWVNSWQHTYTYDANNNQTSELYQTWNGSAWVNSRQSTYTYDANNFIQSEAYKYWNNTGTNITSGDSMYYYFHIVAGINELMANGESIDIYPNPASTSFEITTNNKQIIQEVKLYSIEGKLLKQQTFLENKAKINTSQLPQGMYIIEVKTKKEQVYKKLLILH